MILFDPDQPEAVRGFPQLALTGAGKPVRTAVPSKPTLTRYLRGAQTAVGLKGEVCVLLTTDAGIRALNRRFRKKNKATDVLSFPAEPGFGVAGDLAVSVETAARQAEEQGHRLSVELRVLMLHGLLHLAGYDHEADHGEMARKEKRLRAKLGLPLGLIERVEIRDQRSGVRGKGKGNGNGEGRGNGSLAFVVPTLSPSHPNDEDLSLGTPPARKDGAPGGAKLRSAEPRSQKRDLGHPRTAVSRVRRASR